MNDNINIIKKRLMIIEQEILEMKPYFYEKKDTKEFWNKWTKLKQEKRDLNVNIAKIVNEKKGR